jgi:hypothetical protein
MEKKLHEHGFLAPDNLNGDFFASFRFLKNASSDYIGEHSLAKRREDLVSTTVELLTKDNLIIALRIRGRI